MEVIQLQVINHEQQEELKQLKMSKEAFKNNDAEGYVLHWFTIICSSNDALPVLTTLYIKQPNCHEPISAVYFSACKAQIKSCSE